MKRSHKKYTTIAGVGLCALGALFIASLFAPQTIFFKNNTAENITGDNAIKNATKNPFENIKLEAESVYVMDMTNGSTIYEKNPDAARPIASITKLMTALVALDHTAGNAEQKVRIELRDLSPEGDDALLVNDTWNLKDLVAFTLIKSSNDGAAALGRSTYGDRSVFIKKMNDKATMLNMSHTLFFDDTGLDIDIKNAGSYSSARDIAHLMSAALFEHSDIISQTSKKTAQFKSDSGKIYDIKNTNTIVGELPGLIASKTGYTDLAGGCLVVAFNAGVNHPIIIVVLGSSPDGRFSDVLNLASTTLAYISQE